MNENQNNKLEIEDQLANFTDLILSKKTDKQDESPFAPEPELRALEETVLRLKNTFSEDGPSEVAIRRMQKNINKQWQQQKVAASKPFWKKWFAMLWSTRREWQSQRNRQRVNTILYAVPILALFLVSVFLYNGIHSDQPAASGQNLGIGLLVAVLGIIAAVWFFRHKQ
jgi:hypothetical protein